MVASNVTRKITWDRALGAAIYVEGTIALALLSFLGAVSWWFDGAGVAREHGHFVMRVGSASIDPGDALGWALYLTGWCTVACIPILVFTVLALLDRVGSTSNVKSLLKSNELSAFRRAFMLAGALLMVPLGVQAYRLFVAR